jgi:hypothetical protein
MDVLEKQMASKFPSLEQELKVQQKAIDRWTDL